MKKVTFAAILTVTLFAGGCGSEWTAGGAGAALGVAGSQWLTGVQADLAQQEAELLAQYNAALEAGAKAETLAGLKEQLERNRQQQQAAGTAKGLLGIDWTDPKAAGRALGEVGLLAYALWLRRKTKVT